MFRFMLVLVASASLAIQCGYADDFKPEDGFKPMLNGKDLTGWKTTKGESLDGKTDAYGKRFVMDAGILILDPSVKGDVRIVTTKDFGGDVHIKFDFQPGPKCNNDLFIRGLKFDLKVEDVKEWKEGEWNAFEIVIKGDKAEYKCNGKTIKTMTVKGKATPFELRAELGSMKVRHLRVKEG